MAAFDVNATANQKVGTSGPMTATITTTVDDCLLLAHVYIQAGLATTPNTMVTTVSGSSLTWTLRKRQPGTGRRGYMDVWWAVAPTAGAYSVTASFDSAYDGADMTVTAISGANTASPFDANAMWPYMVGTTAITLPQVTVTTSQADSLLVWSCANNYNEIGAVPSGWPAGNLVTGLNSGGWCLQLTAYKVLTTQQAAQVYTWGGALGDRAGGNCVIYSSMDAIVPAGGGGAPVVVGSVQVMMLS